MFPLLIRQCVLYATPNQRKGELTVDDFNYALDGDIFLNANQASLSDPLTTMRGHLDDISLKLQCKKGHIIPLVNDGNTIGLLSLNQDFHLNEVKTRSEMGQLHNKFDCLFEQTISSCHPDVTVYPLRSNPSEPPVFLEIKEMMEFFQITIPTPPTLGIEDILFLSLSSFFEKEQLQKNTQKSTPSYPMRRM